jgi:hypothetical protein
MDAIALGKLRFRSHDSADVDASRRRVQQWVEARGLVGSREALDWYCAWDTATFVGYSYPHAKAGDGMDLVGRLMAVSILLDDQIDESPSAAACIGAVQPFLEIVRGGGGLVPRQGGPLHHAFAELLRESRARASETWWRRAAIHWEASLIAVVHETVNRKQRGGPPPHDLFLKLRRGSGFMGPFLDILEPAASFEPAALAYYSPHMLLMRQLTVDLGNFINDVFSVDKELARGQHDNIVLVLQAEAGLPLEEARRRARELIHAHACRFGELRAELPEVCAHLGLAASEVEDAVRYGDALEMWITGSEAWGRTSRRYLEALEQRPATGPWAHENLLEAHDGKRLPASPDGT